MMATAFLGYIHSPKWFKQKKKLDNKLSSNNKSFKTTFIFNTKRKYSTVSSNSILRDTSEKSSERLDYIIKSLNLNTVFIFDNVKCESTRQDILNKTRGLSGIYLILNKTTEDYYIGSASTNRIYARFTNHLIQFRGSKVVKAAVKKYGLENFAFIILELYPNIVNIENNKELLDMEDKYLKTLLPNYNILTEAGSMFGYKHTEISRKKLKDIHSDPVFRNKFSQKLKDVYSEQRRKRIGNLNKGKKLLPETIEKLQKAAFNRTAMSDETRNKCITNTRPVVLYNLNRTVFGKFPNILEAAKSINCHEKTIRRALNTDKNLVKRQ